MPTAVLVLLTNVARIACVFSVTRVPHRARSELSPSSAYIEASG